MRVCRDGNCKATAYSKLRAQRALPHHVTIWSGNGWMDMARA